MTTQDGQIHAYPHDLGLVPSKGLTKTEWFMGMILQGMAANSQWDSDPWEVMVKQALKAAKMATDLLDEDAGDGA